MPSNNASAVHQNERNVRLRRHIGDGGDCFAHRLAALFLAAQPRQQTALIHPPLLDEERWQLRRRDGSARRARAARARTEIGIEQIGRRNRFITPRPSCIASNSGYSLSGNGGAPLTSSSRKMRSLRQAAIDERNNCRHVDGVGIVESRELLFDFFGVGGNASRPTIRIAPDA
jgi:hypothetical protein